MVDNTTSIAPAAPATPPATPASASGGVPVTFSSGASINIPAGTSAEDAQKAVDAVGQQEAQRLGGPVTSGDGNYIYSATRRYANTALGEGMAWADHNLGGNFLNKYVADPLNAVVGDEGSKAIYRTTTGALTATPDLAATVYNVGKDYLAPSLPTAPVLGNTVLRESGVAPLGPDAPLWQRVAEGAASGSLGRRYLTGTFGGLKGAGLDLAQTAAGTESADLGGRFGGEAGALAGALLGGGGANAIVHGSLNAAAPLLAHENIANIARAGEESNIPVNFRSLANPGAQRVAGYMSAIPILGSRIEQADEETRSALQNLVQEKSAGAIAGPGGLVPGDATPETIGTNVIEAARNANTAMNARIDAAYAPTNQALSDPTNLSVRWDPVMQGTEKFLRENPPGENIAAATRAPVEEGARSAVGGTGNVQGPPTAQGAVDLSYPTAKNILSGINRNLGPGQVALPGAYEAQVKKLIQNSIRDAGIRAGVPASGTGSYDVARKVAGDLQDPLAQVREIGGQELGDTGQFTRGMGEGQAGNWLKTNLNSPENLAPLAEMGGPAWGRAAGGYISGMGGTAENFRPEHFTKAWGRVGPKVQTMLTQGPPGSAQPGGAGAVARDLSNAATIGSNFVTPMSRFGLQKSMGTGWAMIEGLKHLGHLGEAALGPVLGQAVPAGALLTLGRTLESPTFKRAMAGQGPSVADQLYSTIPALSRLGVTARQGQYGYGTQ